MSVDRRAQEIMARLNKKLGEGTVVMGSEAKTYERFPSGSLGLDVILGGGWPANTWNEIVGEESAGKALALDTPIPSPDGWTTMKAVQVGDRVFDESGKPCLVTFVTGEQYGRACYRVSFSDGSEIIADADHQWQVIEKSNGARRRVAVVTTQSMLDAGLRIRDKAFRYHVVTCQPVDYGAVSALPISPYVLGAWLGAGTSASGGFTTADAEMVTNIEAEGFDIRHRPYLDRPYGYHILGLQPLLRELGVLGNKHIPALYQTASVQDRVSLLAGIVDTDGYVDPRGHIELTTVSERLAHDYYALATGLGHKVHWGEGSATLDGRAISRKYRLTFQSDLPVARLPRKAERLRAARNGRRTYYMRSVVSIESVPSVPVKCIQVDSPSHLYLAGEAMVPTHNTAIAYATVAANQRRDPEFTTVWIAAEDFVPEYASMCGVDTSRLIVVETNIMEDAYGAVISFAESEAVDLVVVDSLPALVPMAEDEKDMDGSTVGRGALQTSKFFRKVTKATKRAADGDGRPFLGIVINQWRMQIGAMYGDPRTTPGGKAKNYHYATRIDLKRDDWIKIGSGQNERRIGQSVVAKTRKNKSAPPNQQTTYDLYFDDGGPVAPGRIDYAKEISALAMVYNLVNRAGAYYRLGEQAWQGKDAFVDAIRNEPEVFSLLEREVLRIARKEAL